MDKTTNHTGDHLILLVDIISMSVAYILAAWIRGGIIQPHFFSSLYGISYVVIILWYITLYLLSSHSYYMFKRGMYAELVSVLKDHLKLAFAVFAYLYVTKQSQTVSRVFLTVFFFLSFLFVYIVRSYTKMYMILGYKKSRFSNRVMLITLADLAESTIEEIKTGYYYNFLIDSIALMDQDMVGENITGIPVIGNEENLTNMIQQHVVDEVFIKLPRYYKINLEELILELEKMGITIHLNLDISNNINIREKRVEVFAGHQVITFSTKMFNEGQILLKRFVDIIGGFCGVIVTGLITIILTPLILIESKGPIFFSQTRIGKNGRHFKIYKFRSMYPDAEERKKELMEQNEMQGFMFKITDDPRITKIGKFIRKTSLDEFPQFVNVLKGDMSLVGTRPPTKDEFDNYEPRHKRRLSLKPGLTGLWQVSGRSDITDFEEVVRLDLEYIDNWSLGLDIKLILKTIKVVLFGKGSK